MTGLLAAEARKLWTLRTTWVLTIVGLAVLALSTWSLISNDLSEGAGARLDVTTVSIGQIGNNSIIVLVIALLVMTTEFRHETVGRTLLLTPSRTRVLVAKLAAGALYAAAFFVASLVIVVVFLFATEVGRTSGVTDGTGTAVWHGLAGLVLTGVLGVAVGALIRSQVVAITVALIWLFIVENLAAALHYGIGRWLPFQALNAVFLGDAAEAIEPGTVGPLPPGLALLVFVGYVVVAAVAAGVLMTRRDV